LNEKKTWHHFVEKYEVKCKLPPDIIVSEIGDMLGKEVPLASKIRHLDEGETDFVKKIIRELGNKYNWNYSVSFERFYSSDVCRMMSGTHVGLSAFSFEEVIGLFDRSFKE